MIAIASRRRKARPASPYWLGRFVRGIVRVAEDEARLAGVDLDVVEGRAGQQLNAAGRDQYRDVARHHLHVVFGLVVEAHAVFDRPFVAQARGQAQARLLEPCLPRRFEDLFGGLRAINEVVFTWLSSDTVQIPFALRLDPLSALMILVVTGIGTLIHLYSTAYMHDETDADFARFFSYLNLFAAFMRQSGANARNKGGLGLGLHIAQAIVTGHGGTIAYRYESPHVVFAVQFPARRG